MNTITKNKGKRDQTWDIVKGIGIVLVVIGHSGCPTYLKHFIYLFHMGLFFFISGMFISTPNINNLWHFIKIRLKRLYIPFATAGIILVLLHNFLFSIGWNIESYDLSQLIKKLIGTLIFKDIEPQLLPLWFLKSLFFSSIIVYIILCINKIQIQIGIIITLYTFGWICSYTHNHLFFSLERECVVSAVIYMGYLLKNKITILYKYGILCLCILLISAPYIWIGLAVTDISFYSAFPLYSLIGIIGITFIAKTLIKTNIGSIMAKLGLNSLEILIIHYPAMQILSQILVSTGLQSHSVLWQTPTIDSLKGTWWWIPYTLCGLGLSLIYIFIKNKIKSIYKK